MNRVAGRAMIVMILVLVLSAGVIFFLGEYVAGAEDWVLFSGSPHVYSNGRLDSGMVLDREGALLVDITDGRSYGPDSLLRKATLHWVGDRQGNVRSKALSHYTKHMVGFDLVGGVYAYGDTSGRMKLTLSASAQKAALEAMGSYKGTVAVYNYKTGELLCAVTTPTFDPDQVPDIEGDTTGRYEGVYINRFTQSVYIPGSIFKTVTLAAALETVPDIQEQTFTCTGTYAAGTGVVTCEYVHGKQDLKSAFSNSCNCAFAQIIEQLGKDKLTQYVEQFGVTRAVDFDGITTAAGNFDLTNAYHEEIAWAGIGQYTDQVNPCAFMTFMGAIAGGGVGVQPHVVAQVKVGDTVPYSAKAVKGQRIMSKSTAETLTRMLQNNVQVKYGAENFPGFTVCAKSGTGQVGGDKKPNAMFAGFLTDEAYPYAFIVAVEDGGYGSQVCVPIIAKVLQACKDAANRG